MSATEKDFILKSYKIPGTTINSICRKIGRRKKTVSNFLKKSGIDVIIPPPPITERIYDLDESYFDEIDTHAKAYILGFLFADGVMRRTERHLAVQLADIDIDVLRFIKNEIKSNSPIRHHKSKTDNHCPLVSILICSKLMCGKLINHGMVPNKSLVLRPPKNLPAEFVNSFILGYFDGDGTIYKNGSGMGINILGTREMLEFISESIRVGTGIRARKLFPINNKDKNSYKICWNGRVMCAKIREYLYSGNTFSLSRKANKMKIAGSTNPRKLGRPPKNK